MDVDWSKTNQGRKYYNTQSAVDFAAAGISHVRIRIADKVDQELLEGLDRQIRDCLDNGIIPIIAYQADAFKMTQVIKYRKGCCVVVGSGRTLSG